MNSTVFRQQLDVLADQVARNKDGAVDALVSNSTGQFLWAAFEHREIAEYLQKEWRPDVVRVAQRMFGEDQMVAAPVDVVKDLLGELRALRDEEAARCAERERLQTPEGFDQRELFADEEVVDV